MNTEKFRSITIGCFNLMDSMAFIQGSLSELVSNLKDSDCDFPILQQMDAVIEKPSLFDMLLRKGVYPYEFATSIKKLEKTKQIPPHKSFYSSLTDSNVSVDDYEYAKKMFRVSNCQNMMDYTLLYLETDTYLLADVFQEFRDKLMAQFKLDPSRYLSLPSYSYDSML